MHMHMHTCTCCFLHMCIQPEATPPPFSQVLVTFTGSNCETVVWPDDLHDGEPPLVLVSQDECAFHGNDDCPYEWCEKGRGMSLKQKSRGTLLMVSEFLSELRGRLRCTKAEAEAYAAEYPASIIATKLLPQYGDKWAGDCRVVIEPGTGPGKDKYFDNEQLMAQTEIAMEVYSATHFAPAREVTLSEGVTAGVSLRIGSSQPHPQPRDQPVRLRLDVGRGAVKQLSRVRCQALILYDHSSGHEAGATDGRSVTPLNKGPDWSGKLPCMRDGYCLDLRGQSWPRIPQRMQFAQGDCLPCDLVVPAGMDMNVLAGAAATTARQVHQHLPMSQSHSSDPMSLSHSSAPYHCLTQVPPCHYLT